MKIKCECGKNMEIEIETLGEEEEIELQCPHCKQNIRGHKTGDIFVFDSITS